MPQIPGAPRQIFVLAAALWLLCLANAVTAESLALRTVLTGLTRPVAMAHAGDHRLFVVEQVGRIRIVADGQLRSTPFLDIDALVRSAGEAGAGNEQGLLGLAFHPSYAIPGASGEGLFWVNYTDNAGDTVIARYSVFADEPDAADPDSAVVIMTIDQTASNHNGGQLQFGPAEGASGSRFLYVGMGDGGGGNDPGNAGQSDDTLLGKMLRIEPSTAAIPGIPAYRLPDDNPNAAVGAPLGTVWAKGLRNPWRFSFDALTGELFIADVGQRAREEVNVTAAGSPGGLNYGWKIMEGQICRPPTTACDQTGLALPAFDYARSGGRCAVIGGHVYRGRRYPALRGSYLYADFCSREVFRARRSELGVWSSEVALGAPTNPLTFGEDSHGEVYLAGNNGTLYQIIDLEASVALAHGLTWFSPPVQVPAGFGCADLRAQTGATAVARLNGNTQQFEFCADTGAGFDLRDGEGYLLHLPASAPGTLVMTGMPSCPRLSAGPGLQMIGVPNAVPGAGCFELLTRLGGAAVVATVQGLDLETGRIQSCGYATEGADGQRSGTDFSLQPGNAYLVAMRSASTAVSLHDPRLCSAPDG